MPKWLHTIGFSLGGAIAGFAGTWLVVWWFGLAVYADYLIDLAKTSVILLVLEALPNGYSLFRQQRDGDFAQAYPAFYALMAVTLTLVAIGLSGIGYFEKPNIFLTFYVGLAVLQRYLDCELQSSGHIEDYFRITTLTNVLRILFLIIGSIVFGLGIHSKKMAVSELLWGSLASALLISILVASYRHVTLFTRLFVAFHPASFTLLWRDRSDYRPYYVNSLLKRAKDTMLPLLLDQLFVDKALMGLIIVYAKSFELVAGQLRVIEVAFTNLAHRVSLDAGRTRIAWIAATVGQPACVVIAAILLRRQGLGIDVITPAALLSFGVYPYVFEILARNDALASERPSAVTVSLIVYVSILCVGLLSLSSLRLLGPLAIVFVMLTAQCVASVSYRLKRSDGTPIGKR